MSSSWLDWDQTLLVPCSITSSFLVLCALPFFFLPHNSWFTCTVASLLTLLKSPVRTKTIVLGALKQVLTFKGRAVSSCVLLSDNNEQSLISLSCWCTSKEIPTEGCSFLFSQLYCAVLYCQTLADGENWGKNYMIFPPKWVDVDGLHLRKANCVLLFCWQIKKILLHLVVATSQNFFQLFIPLLFFFSSPFISHFSLWLNMEWDCTSDTRCFEILNCVADLTEGAVIIDSIFTDLTVLMSLKQFLMLSFPFLFITPAAFWCFQCDQQVWRESCRLEETSADSQRPRAPQHCHWPDSVPSSCQSTW